MTLYDLKEIFQKFGEEKYAEKLAQTIIDERQGTMINTTGEFKAVIRKAFK